MSYAAGSRYSERSVTPRASDLSGELITTLGDFSFAFGFFQLALWADPDCWRLFYLEAEEIDRSFIGEAIPPIAEF